MIDKELPARVLHVVSSMDRGGAETLIMNVYRNINRDQIQFDFISHNQEHGSYDQEIKALGGEIFNVPSLGTSGPISYLKNLIGVISKKDYAAVHIHTDFQSGFPALAAWGCGIKQRICHSHSNNWLKNTLFHSILLRILQLMIKTYSTKLCSCSYEAAEFLFGKRAIRKNKVRILKNGIDIYDYLDSRPSEHISLLNELKIDKTAKVIGHIGRFSESKNQLFILKVLKELRKHDSRYVAIFVGDGPLKEKVEKEAEKMELREHVRFLGTREDIPILMQVFHVFLFPSLFEGFGIVMLEAQCSGVPCIASSKVPKSTDMELGLAEYLNIKEGAGIWSRAVQRAILKEKPSSYEIEQCMNEKGFNIKKSIQEWLEMYGLAECSAKIDREELAYEKKYSNRIV